MFLVYQVTSRDRVFRGLCDFMGVTTVFIIFCDFLMFYQIFLSPQVKRSAIISNIHGIYELPHELPNELTLRILRHWKRSGKSQNFI